MKTCRLAVKILGYTVIVVIDIHGFRLYAARPSGPQIKFVGLSDRYDQTWQSARLFQLSFHVRRAQRDDA